jgi:hypothetical protein
MKKIFLGIQLTLIILANSYGQSNREIDLLIKGLSWDIIHEGRSARTFGPLLESPGSDLIRIGSPAAEELFKSICDANKTVLIHIILTYIFEPENGYYYPHTPIYSYCYMLKDYKKDIGSRFMFNGLVWEWFTDTGYSIESSQIARIKSYWDKKLHDPINAFAINPEDLLTDIHIYDSIKYLSPDKKVYKNNSENLNYYDLRSLFIMNYPNPYFSKIFRILGNDSIVWNNDRDCYISYITDGIEFEIRDDKLIAINLKACYKGSLINNVKMTDNRIGVSNKLGIPIEWHVSPSYTYDWFFKKYHMFVAFGGANRIIDLKIQYP